MCPPWQADIAQRGVNLHSTPDAKSTITQITPGGGQVSFTTTSTITLQKAKTITFK